MNETNPAKRCSRLSRYCQEVLRLATSSARRMLKSIPAPPVLTTTKHETDEMW